MKKSMWDCCFYVCYWGQSLYRSARLVSQEGKLNVKWGRARTNWNIRRKTRTPEHKLELNGRNDLWEKLAVSATELHTCLAQDLEKWKEEMQWEVEGRDAVGAEGAGSLCAVPTNQVSLK